LATLFFVTWNHCHFMIITFTERGSNGNTLHSTILKIIEFVRLILVKFFLILVLVIVFTVITFFKLILPFFFNIVSGFTTQDRYLPVTVALQLSLNFQNSF